MEDVINEVSRKKWVYDKDGKGKLCDCAKDAERLMATGDYADHPDGPWGKSAEAEAEPEAEKAQIGGFRPGEDGPVAEKAEEPKEEEPVEEEPMLQPQAPTGKSKKARKGKRK